MFVSLFFACYLALSPGIFQVNPAPRTDSLVVLSWNLENFFDWKCDSLSTSEMEFSSSGARRWTWKRFNRKCSGIAKTVLASASRTGRLPDVLAFQEVENRRALTRLIEDTPLRKCGYRTVHFESPDRRGIDCALLYRSSSLKLKFAAPCHLYDSTGKVLRTRDIVLAEFFLPQDSGRFAVLVNHHPSKLGRNSGSLRDIATGRMVQLADSLVAGGCGSVVAVGDFNRPMDWIDKSCKGGTLKFNGNWERIDGCPLARGSDVREIVLDFPFLLTRNTSSGGLKPLRTYSGPRYLGGISDHLPVVSIIIRGHP